jgi:hypothetical protein
MKIEAATDVRIAEFLKRTRRHSLHGRGAFSAWLESPEAKALERDSRRLRAKAKAGK